MKDEQHAKEKFKEMAETVQAVVSGAKDLQEVFAHAAELTKSRNAKTIAAAGFTDEDMTLLKTICDEKGLRLLEPPFRNHLEKIHTGLTPADCAIAETGTIVLDSAAEDMRIATMLSEIHVACVAASRIKANAMEAAEFLDGRLKSAPCYTAFITGASRTADIERVLTIGVHGPQELHILITEEDITEEDITEEDQP